MSDTAHDRATSAARLANATETDYPRESCVHDLLELQVPRRSGATAVEFAGHSLTYAELHARANQLARMLRKRGVQREVLVGVCIERSIEMVVALLGILKAGGAYVPLDPSYGIGRIQYVLEEARVRVLITQESLRSWLPATTADVVCLDPSFSSLVGESDQPMPSGAGPSDLAYVIYTSGSTGKPKGVQLEHRSVVNFLCSMRRQPGLDSNDALLAVTTLSFDIAGLEIFLPLMVGARLVVASREATFDGNLLKNLLKDSGVTVLQATPTTWRLLLESGWLGDRNLKALVGGEAFPPELARKLAATCGSVWNMYGPTETTIWSSLYRVDRNEDRTVPIGKPIANTTLYVLDGNRQPVRPGVEGELYIGGEGLARGYFELPLLTAEKFLPDPFSRPPARMYRTGDLVRCRPDGNIEFLGRLDHQVKIRGFRIELGEVEAVLEQHPEIQQAVAVARDGSLGDKYLAAYFIPRPDHALNLSEVRERLRKQLPEYMIPSAFVRMSEFPLTPNGKVDRKQLPAPQVGDYQSGREYVAPRDTVERKLARLWEEVLEVRPIGAKDSFFDLGGRSLLAARLFIKIVHVFGKELPLTTLIHAPTVELLANELRPAALASEYPTLVPMRRSGSKAPFFCVHGGAGSTLFLHRLAGKMDSDQPFYGIEPEGLNGKRFQRTTLEQMAANYLSEIRKVQPVGPYYLGGYCLGGIVAFEMAQQLRRQGESAALVALFTAPLRFHRRVAATKSDPPVAKPASSRIATLMKSPLRVLYRKSARLITVARGRLAPTAYRVWFRLGLKIPPSMRTLYVWRTLFRAEQNYVPQPYPGRLVLFHGSEYENDPSLGWQGLAERLDHRIIGSSSQDSRRDLMNEPLVNETARELTACITSASAETKLPPTSEGTQSPLRKSA